MMVLKCEEFGADASYGHGFSPLGLGPPWLKRDSLQTEVGSCHITCYQDILSPDSTTGSVFFVI